jgi:hypothetical protein
LSMSVLMAKPNNNGTLACRPSQAAGPSPAMSGFRRCRLPLSIAAFGSACHTRQNGLLTSSAIDAQQVPISRNSRSLREASSRLEWARARQI